MKQAVITQSMPASGEMPAADCPEEELEEEGISLAECEYMVSHVEGIALSTPDWFPSVQMGLTFAVLFWPLFRSLLVAPWSITRPGLRLRQC